MNCHKWSFPIFLIFVALTTLSGCASGPSYNSVLLEAEPIEDGSGRIVIYRESDFLSTSSYPVLVEGKSIGDLTAGSFLMVDVAKGFTSVKAGAYSLKITVSEGITSYIAFIPNRGYSTVSSFVLNKGNLILVDEDEALHLLKNLSYSEE